MQLMPMMPVWKKHLVRLLWPRRIFAMFMSARPVLPSRHMAALVIHGNMALTTGFVELRLTGSGSAVHPSTGHGQLIWRAGDWLLESAEHAMTIGIVMKVTLPQ